MRSGKEPPRKRTVWRSAAGSPAEFPTFFAPPSPARCGVLAGDAGERSLDVSLAWSLKWLALSFVARRAPRAERPEAPGQSGRKPPVAAQRVHHRLARHAGSRRLGGLHRQAEVEEARPGRRSDGAE